MRTGLELLDFFTIGLLVLSTRVLRALSVLSPCDCSHFFPIVIFAGSWSTPVQLPTRFWRAMTTANPVRDSCKSCVLLHPPAARTSRLPRPKLSLLQGSSKKKDQVDESPAPVPEETNTETPRAGPADDGDNKSPSPLPPPVAAAEEKAAVAMDVDGASGGGDAAPASVSPPAAPVDKADAEVKKVRTPLFLSEAVSSPPPC